MTDLYSGRFDPSILRDQLLETRRMLDEVRKSHADEGARSRAGILIENIDRLNADPADRELKEQFRHNYRDFQMHMAGLK